MKTLPAEPFSPRRLRRAWLRVEESDGCAGIDGVSIDRFRNSLTEQLERLHRGLLDGTYFPLPLLRFRIPKKDGEMRPLNVAAVRDRVAQRAVIDIIEPLLEAEFEECSFGFRRGRSVRLALDRIEFLRDSGYTWVVEADIDDYFDTVDHNTLFSKVDTIVSDLAIQKLIRLWVRARIYDGSRLFTVESGLPQGQPISPILANLYLDKFDEMINKGGRKLVRYADDFVILCKSKPKAEAALRLTRRLIKELDLDLNEEDTGVTHFNTGFSYLGAKFFRSLCLVPERKRRTNPGGVAMPEKLFSHLPSLEEHRFNPIFGQKLARALSLDQKEDGMTSDKDQTTVSNDYLPPANVTLTTLYIHEHGATVRYENERIEVDSYGRELISIPIRKIEQIILYGNSQITTALMKKCLQARIPIFIFSGPARLLGSIESHDAGNIELQRIQFERQKDDVFRLDIARRIIAGKIENSRGFLQRRSRELKTARLKRAVDQLDQILITLADASALNEVMGCEGAAAAAYFGDLGECLTSPFRFVNRSKRPPLDPVNAMLSFGYTMLLQNIYALVRARGLSPFIGFLHSESPGHPALCSDLIEEFRSAIVDPLVLGVLNRRILTPDDFYYEEVAVDHEDDAEPPEFSGPPDRADGRVRRCLLKDAARRSFIVEFERRMNTVVTHKGARVKTTWRGCVDLQVGHFIKVLRNEVAHYRPIEFR